MLVTLVLSTLSFAQDAATIGDLADRGDFEPYVLPSRAELAARRTNNIVGGSSTSDFEAVGAIGFARGGSLYGTFCSGTLVDRNWVVTAAHCLDNNAAQGYLNSGYDVIFLLGTNLASSSGLLDYAYVTDVTWNSGYSSSRLTDDIGVMELTGGGITSVTPIALNTSTPSSSWGEITYVGFGITGDGRSDSGVKRTVDVDFFRVRGEYIDTWDPDGERNICSGDSGGAALYWNGSQYVLAGANSHGYDRYGGYPYCEGDGAVGASARTDYYASWLASNMSGSSSGGSSSGGSSSGGSSGGSSSGGSSSGGSSSGGSSSGGSSSGGSSSGGSSSGGSSGGGGAVDTGYPGEDAGLTGLPFGETDAPTYGCSATGLGAVGVGALLLPAVAVGRRRDD